MEELQKLELRLQGLQDKKEIVRKRSAKKGENAVNNLLNAITDAVTSLENLISPQELAEAKQTALAEIKRAHEAIDQELIAMPPSLFSDYPITAAMKRESEDIRFALGRFDGKALAWIEQQKREGN